MAPPTSCPYRVRTPPMPDRALRRQRSHVLIHHPRCVRTPPMPDRALRPSLASAMIRSISVSVRTPPMPDRALRRRYRSPHRRRKRCRVRTPPMPDRALRRRMPPASGGPGLPPHVRTPPMPDRALRRRGRRAPAAATTPGPNASNARQGIKTTIVVPGEPRPPWVRSERLQCPTGH